MSQPPTPIAEPRDAEYHDHEITGVRRSETTEADAPIAEPGRHRYDFEMVGSGILGVADGPLPFEPEPGDTLRLYGTLFGRVRGMEVIRGGSVATLYYRNPAEHEAHLEVEAERQDEKRRAEFERDRADLDARYDALPEVFRRRLDKFRGNNPDFRWQFEPYELFVCEEAVNLAGHVVADAETEDLDQSGPNDEWVRYVDEWIRSFRAMPTDRQVEEFELDDGHSGNTFGATCTLARLYLTGEAAEDGTPGVVAMHGALAPLVGSREYGCVPRDEAGDS